MSIATAPDYGIVFGRQFNALQYPATALFAASSPMLAMNSVSGMISHFWSPSVEVIFYGLLPWVVRARFIRLTFGLVIGLRPLLLALTPVESPLHQIVPLSQGGCARAGRVGRVYGTIAARRSNAAR
ncbi:MAG: hypothetical protein IPK17_19440 [Chloroflexi bacterium]|uniref:hypothetical protein n=1 Tax=Candidatus Flexifilum breve TaxID=3140694 RepID=UPI0031367B98|nr:hypothetical protein [Chloroflexota bacterium]